MTPITTVVCLCYMIALRYTCYRNDKLNASLKSVRVTRAVTGYSTRVRTAAAASAKVRTNSDRT